MSRPEHSMDMTAASRPSTMLRSKRKTLSKKHHRFEPFSSRVAAIKVKPFRINETERRQHDVVNDQNSHFKICLDKWRNQNMSTDFTAFSEDVDPYSQNLTQVVHYRSEIVDHIIQHIENRDAHSLEPLLELLVRLADDLWLRFEEFFERCVKTVANVAASHPEVEAVEWSFDAMAGLFKRFARLLEKNLVPLFDLMSPMLGRTRQKTHVSRFSAEAMSFLVRRAASVTDIDIPPLDALMEHALSDLAHTPESQQSQYQLGLMTMFVDAIENTQMRVRESGPDIIKSMLRYVFHSGSSGDHQQLELARPILEGVLVSIIHHTNVETFQPILEAVLMQCRSIMESDQCPGNVETVAHLLHLISGVRQGSRLPNAGWHHLLATLQGLIKSQDDEFSQDLECAEVIITAVATVIQYCPLEIVTPCLDDILTRIQEGVFKSLFLQFCVVLNELGQERFTRLVQPQMREFIVKTWEHSSTMTLAVLPRFDRTGLEALKIELTTKDLRANCLSLQEMLNDKSLPIDSTWLYQLDARLHLLTSSIPPASRFPDSKEVLTLLQQIVAGVLQHGRAQTNENLLCFVGGRVLYSLLYMDPQSGSSNLDVSSIVQMSPHHRTSRGYIQALHALFRDQERIKNLSKEAYHSLLRSLERNLSDPLQDIRRLSLRVLSLFMDGQHEHEHARVFEQSSNIETKTFDLRNVRTMSLMVRKLGHLALRPSTPEWLSRLVAAHCLGMMFIKLAPMWEDSIQVLKQLCSSSSVSELVVNILVDWVSSQGSRSITIGDDHSAIPHAPKKVNEFQCSNIMSLDYAWRQNKAKLSEANASLREQFENVNLAQNSDPSLFRLKALTVMQKLPSLAETRSRSFVPIFLEWFSSSHGPTKVDDELDSDEDTVSSPVPSDSIRASRDDQKSMLNVFAKFGNPKALFKADEVKECLTNLLSSGDGDIQRPALQTLFSWRDPAIRPYEASLLNLLDDSRFRDELTVLFHSDGEGTMIKEEHKGTLMPMLLRLLYGRAISRVGTKDRGGLVIRRKAVLNSLAQLSTDALREFVSVAMDPLNVDHVLLKTEPPSLNEQQLSRQDVPWKKQIGLVKMVQDIAASSSNQLAPVAGSLMQGSIFVLVSASRALKGTVGDDTSLAQHHTLAKTARQEAMRALTSLFEACPDHDWSFFKPIIMSEIVSSRLKDLTAENAQGVSALFKLFSSWTTSVSMIDLLVRPEQSVLQCLAQSLSGSILKEEVQLFVLNDIFNRAFRLIHPDNMVEDDDEKGLCLFRRELDAQLAATLLKAIQNVLASNPNKEILDASTDVVEQLKPFLRDDVSVRPFAQVLVSLLDLGRKNTNHVARSRLLQVLDTYLPRCHLSPSDEYFGVCYDVLSSLFSYFQDVPSRQLLSRVFKQLVAKDEKLHAIACVSEALNARSSSRLGQTDDAALDEAFSSILTARDTEFTAREWQPLLHNFLYLVKDDTDLSPARLGASSCLRQFAQCLQSNDAQSASAFWYLTRQELVKSIVLPSIRKGIRSSSETIRGEYLMLLEELVKNNASGCEDMKVLLGGDDFPSFFKAALAMQHSQRLNAWRGLAQEAHCLDVKSITSLFIPLIETTVAHVTEKNQNLVNEAVKALEDVAGSLLWGQYRNLIQRMIGESKRFESKLSIRVFGAVVNAFHKARLQKESTSSASSRLAKSIPDDEVISSTLGKTVLPKMMQFLHFKDEATVDLRVPVANSAIRVIVALPPDEVSRQAPPLLMDICNILKSKAQEARDAARRTLSEITVLLGPVHFGFVLKQLKSALPRGAQLHVLSFTVQYLLRIFVPHLRPGDLDHCLNDLVAIAINDVFGTVGEEKEAGDYTSRTKEVRSPNKGYDTFELTASIITPNSLDILLYPLRRQLDKPRPKLSKVTALMDRFNKAIYRNAAMFSAESRDHFRDIFETTDNESHVALRKFAADALIIIWQDPRWKQHAESSDVLGPNIVMEGIAEDLRFLPQANEVATILFSDPTFNVDASDLPKQLLFGATAIWVEPNNPMDQRVVLAMLTKMLKARPDANILKKDFIKCADQISAALCDLIKAEGEQHELVRLANEFLRQIVARGADVANSMKSLDCLMLHVREMGLDREPEKSERAYRAFLAHKGETGIRAELTLLRDLLDGGRGPEEQRTWYARQVHYIAVELKFGKIVAEVFRNSWA